MSCSNNPNGLTREIGVFSATLIVIANMIGAGIFTTSGIMAGMLPGPMWVIGCWVLGGLIALSGALSYGELATRMPGTGGEYQYLKKLFHPAAGFLTGWTSFIVGFSVPIALSAMAFTEYLFASLAMRLDLAAVMPLSIDWTKKLFSIALIVVFTGMHLLGKKFGGIIQNILALIKFALLAGLLFLGFSFGAPDLSRLSLVSDFGNTGWAMGASMIIVMFAYSGWNASTYIAGEFKRPSRDLPISLILGTGLVLLIYLLVNIFIFSAAPYGQLQGEVTVVEKASSVAFGNWIGVLFSGIIGIATLSSLSAYIMVGPRVYYAMARDGLFFSFAGKVNPEKGVPGRAILIQGILATAMIIAGSFEQLLIYVGYALGIFPLMAVVGLFIARSRGIGDDTASRVSGYPFVPAFFIIASLALLVFTFIEKPVESSCAIVTVLLGIPFYLFWVKGGEKLTVKKKAVEIEV